jgi:hypothetical protein
MGESSGAEQTSRPVFIVGCPRSGTRLVARAIGGHPSHFLVTEHADKSICPEDTSGLLDQQLWWGTFEYPQWARGDGQPPPIEAPIANAEATRKIRAVYLALSGHRRLVVKNPSHLLRLEILKEAFPDARFVFVIRDPWETMQSIITKGSDSYLVRTARVRSLPDDLLLRAAVSWQEAVDIYLREHDPSWSVVRYDALLADPVRAIDSMFDALAIPRDDYRARAATLPYRRKVNVFAIVRRFRASGYQREILEAIGAGCEQFRYPAEPVMSNASAVAYYHDRMRGGRVASALRRLLSRTASPR